MDKEDVVYMCNGILLNHRKNKSLPFATPWMDLESIMLSEISQTEKYNYCMMSLIYGVYKIQQTNEDNKKETDSQILRIN